MTKTPKDISVNKKVKENQQAAEYIVQMKRPKKFPWWIFLLLIPLLLLIECEKDITVTCIEEDTGVAAPGVPVQLNYTAHFLWKNSTLLFDQPVERTQTTDQQGKTTFKDLPCSVFSYIFYFFSDVTFNAKNECVAAADEKRQFHTTKNVELMLSVRYEDVSIQLIDEENSQPLPDGSIEYTVNDNGKTKTGTAKADKDGFVVIPHVRYCADVDIIKGTCYGYEDKEWTKLPARELADNGRNNQMPLKPLYQTLEFHTVDADCREILPGCSLQITGSVSGALTPTDSGNGIFEVTMRMNEKLTIIASKNGFRENNTTVNNLTFNDLQDADKREIPLEVDAEPCGGDWVEDDEADNGFLVKTYHLGNPPGKTVIEVDFDAAEDSITIYDGTCRKPENILYQDYINNSVSSIPVNYTKENITIVMKGNTIWKFKVNCPEP